MELFASAESGMEQASFDGGAGRRIRTPDLLITKMRLYVYRAHYVPVLPDTSNFSVSFRAINLHSIKAFFVRWRQGWRQKSGIHRECPHVVDAAFSLRAKSAHPIPIALY